MGKEMINASEVLRAQLAHSLGLDTYATIVSGNPKSPDFQRMFNGYYRVRRNEKWREHYYELFIIAKANHYSFEQIISDLYAFTGNVEASFSSKMLATTDPSKPIWDQYVLRNLGLELTGKTQEQKLVSAIELYSRIEAWYANYLLTPEAKANIMEFDQLLPEYAWISKTKKIDCLLWSKRN